MVSFALFLESRILEDLVNAHDEGCNILGRSRTAVSPWLVYGFDGNLEIEFPLFDHALNLERPSCGMTVYVHLYFRCYHIHIISYPNTKV